MHTTQEVITVVAFATALSFLIPAVIAAVVQVLAAHARARRESEAQAEAAGVSDAQLLSESKREHD